MINLIKDIETNFKNLWLTDKLVFYGDEFQVSKDENVIVVKTQQALFDVLDISEDSSESIVFVEVYCYSDTLRGSQSLVDRVIELLQSMENVTFKSSISVIGSGIKGNDNKFKSKKWYNIVRANASLIK